MSATQTRSSTPRLSDLARKIAVPDGVVTTGWPAVLGKCTDLGIKFRDWQHGSGQLLLAKRADGKYAATIGGTGMSIPRQVGKTYLVGAIVFALCLLRPGLTVIWTAHRLRTAEETFGKMQTFSRRSKIKPHVEKIWLGSGEEEIRFHNGSRIMFGARERGFGRGFDEVDVLVFDEAQILTDSALDDMIPATNQSRQDTGALLLFMGTPPKPEDKGDVFRRMRTEATSGEDADTGWIEFGADPDFMPTQLPAPLESEDWAQVAKANPSFPMDTPREAVLRMRKKLGADSFLREGLGLWTDVSIKDSAIDADVWAKLKAPAPPWGRDISFALDVAPDLSSASIAAAWKVDGGTWLQLADHRPGVDWIAGRWRELSATYDGRLLIEQNGTAAFLIPTLASVEAVSRRFFVDACSTLEAAVTARSVQHGCQGELNAAVAAAHWSTSGESGQRVLSRKDPRVSPLVAAANALHGASTRVHEPFMIVT